MKVKIFFSAGLILMLTLAAMAVEKADPADAVVGVWLTQDKDGKIEIFKKGDKYYGKLIWGKDLVDANGDPKLDVENPDESLRSRTLKGLLLLTGFEYVGDNEWEDGKIYDPQNGKTYSCIMTLKKDELEVRGYIGFSLIGRTVTWTRVK